jgi:hypothetical protein
MRKTNFKGIGHFKAEKITLEAKDYGCPIAQVLFPVYSSCIWLIYMHFECFQRLLQLNFDFTKCKIPIPGYISCIS